MTPAELAARWRADVDLLRRRGAAAQADVLLGCADELEQQQREHALEALTLEQAAAESGYSYSALEKLVRGGQLANAGQKGAPRVRRGDLPRKPTHPAPVSNGDDLATLPLRRHLVAGGPRRVGR